MNSDHAHLHARLRRQAQTAIERLHLELTVQPDPVSEVDPITPLDWMLAFEQSRAVNRALKRMNPKYLFLLYIWIHKQEYHSSFTHYAKRQFARLAREELARGH